MVTEIVTMAEKKNLPKTEDYKLWLKGKCAEISVQQKELEYISAETNCVIVCNRFSSKYEDAILSAIIARITKNYRLITTNKGASSFLDDGNIVCVKDSALQTWDAVREKLLNGVRQVYREGKTVVIFPSRRIRRYTFERIAWDKEIVAAIQQLNAPVIPVYIKRRPLKGDGYIEQAADYTYRLLGSEDELQFDMRVGKVIKPAELEKFTSNKQFRRFLFAKTHALGSPLEVDDFYQPQALSGTQAPVDANVDVKLIAAEIETIAAYKVAEKGKLETYICPTYVIPNIMKEIGIRRETTYREVGEGTGKSCDIDEYDLYYYQLFIWDKDKQVIAGGYRMGCGDEIMKKYGRSGFYIRSLFKIDKQMGHYLEHSVELGRSFILAEYQKGPFSLFLLWKSIYIFLEKNPQYNYLIGPVSISADYSQFSRQLIVAFLKTHFYDEELSKLVQARNPFKETLPVRKKKVLLGTFNGIMNNLDKFVEDVEPKHFKVPILIKQYIRQNGKFLGFNVDPAFSNAVDCLIMIDARNLPNSTIENMK